MGIYNTKILKKGDSRGFFLIKIKEFGDNKAS